jgi:hypothetical protein
MNHIQLRRIRNMTYQFMFVTVFSLFKERLAAPGSGF